jgi:HAD superfamily hydrolase (TIGR01509 family)
MPRFTKGCEIVYNWAMLDIQKIRVLCFDVDGTLSDTDDYYVNKLSDRFQRLPRFLVREPERAARRFVMWSESPGNALLGLTDTIGLDRPIVSTIDFIYRHRRRKWRKFLIVPGVLEMLTRLRGQYPMVIVSARDEDSTTDFLKEFDLLKYFDVIISVLSARHTKPYPDPILLAAQKMGVPPEACLMIGDTTVDVRAGKAAGAQTISVLCGFGEEDELRRRNPDLILPSTADLADALLGK